jgi:hypothetical protein
MAAIVRGVRYSIGLIGQSVFRAAVLDSGAEPASPTSGFEAGFRGRASTTASIPDGCNQSPDDGRMMIARQVLEPKHQPVPDNHHLNLA